MKYGKNELSVVFDLEVSNVFVCCFLVDMDAKSGKIDVLAKLLEIVYVVKCIRRTNRQLHAQQATNEMMVGHGVRFRGE